MNNAASVSNQVGGTHYNTGYVHWDFVVMALDGRYLEGNVTKYVARWRKKNGLQDLKKARHYLDKLIEQFNLGNVQPMPRKYLAPHLRASHFCDLNGLELEERRFIQAIVDWQSRRDLHFAGGLLDALIVYAENNTPAVTHTDGEHPGRRASDHVEPADPVDHSVPSKAYIDQG